MCVCVWPRPRGALSLGDATAVSQGDAAQRWADALQQTDTPVAQPHTAADVQLPQVTQASRQVLQRHVGHLPRRRRTEGEGDMSHPL